MHHSVVVCPHLHMAFHDRVLFAVVTKDKVEGESGESGEAKDERSEGRILTTLGVGMMPCLLLALLKPDAGYKACQ
jgi:hypothetical protein